MTQSSATKTNLLAGFWSLELLETSEFTVMLTNVAEAELWASQTATFERRRGGMGTNNAS